MAGHAYNCLFITYAIVESIVIFTLQIILLHSKKCVDNIYSYEKCQRLLLWRRLFIRIYFYDIVYINNKLFKNKQIIDQYDPVIKSIFICMVQHVVNTEFMIRISNVLPWDHVHPTSYILQAVDM